MTERFPDKKPGDVITARRINSLSSVADRVLDGGANVKRSEGTKGLLPADGFLQRIMIITGRDDDGLALAKMRYYSFDEDAWKTKEDDNEWRLDDSELRDRLSVNNKVVAWWDKQRGAFIPIVTDDSPCKPLAHFYSEDNVAHIVGERDDPTISMSLNYSENGVDNWQSVVFEGPAFQGRHDFTWHHASTLNIDQTNAFLRVEYEAFEADGVVLVPQMTIVRLSARCADPIGNERLFFAVRGRVIHDWKVGPTVNNNLGDVFPVFAVDTGGKLIKVTLPDERSWAIDIDVEMKVGVEG